MKMQKLASSNTSANPKTMSKAQQDELVGLTLNEAFERGLITDIGNDKGEFIFEHADDDIDAHYAVINGSAVRVSQTVVDDLDNIDDFMGDLTFHAGISDVEGEGKGKYWFRLGKPAGIRLGDSVKSVVAEPASNKNPKKVK